MTVFGRSVGVLAPFVLAVFAAGCGKPVLRVADASLGDYYTEREFKKLRREQREEYCSELARQDSAYRAEILDSREALDALRARSKSLRVEGDSLFAMVSRLEAMRKAAGAGSTPPRDAGRAGAGPAAAGAPSGVHVVRAGESLWRIGRSEGLPGLGRAWRTIYDGNRGKIRDPNLIFPGQELTIPR